MADGKGIVGHGGRRQSQVVVTKQITLIGCNLEVSRTEDGGRMLQILDPAAGAVYLLPLPPEVAREVGNQLFSAVQVADGGQMPKGRAA